MLVYAVPGKCFIICVPSNWFYIGVPSKVVSTEFACWYTKCHESGLYAGYVLICAES